MVCRYFYLLLNICAIRVKWFVGKDAPKSFVRIVVWLKNEKFSPNCRISSSDNFLCILRQNEFGSLIELKIPFSE